MRRAVLLGLIGLLPAAAEAQKFGMAGCGLGSLIFSGSGKGSQILASTTNGTAGSQTFGITSGTSNCTTEGTVTSEREQEVYAEVNLASLSQEMASGGGEYLAGMATLLGCERNIQPIFFDVAQASYERIFPSEKTSSTEMLQALKLEMRANAPLATGCHRI